MERVVAGVGAAMTARPSPPAPRMGAGGALDGGCVEGVLIVVTPGEYGPALAPVDISTGGAVGGFIGGGDPSRCGGVVGGSIVLLSRRRPRAPLGTGGRAGPAAGWPVSGLRPTALPGRCGTVCRVTPAV